MTESQYKQNEAGDMNAGMTALSELNALRAEARRLGIEKPNTMKRDELKSMIEVAKQAIADRKLLRESEGDPFDDIDPAVEGDHLPSEETIADALAERAITREAWLLSAIEKLTPMLKQAGAHTLDSRRISISVGFPSKSIRKRIGECWTVASSGDGGTNHLFISPMLGDTTEVLGVLVHELIHVDDDCASQHHGHFRKVAKAVGLTGKMTDTNVSEDLEPVLKDLAEELGEYPHTKLTLGSNIKKQATRLLKVHCADDTCLCFDGRTGYTIRVTQKWIEIGLPKCPGGTDMTVAE